MRQAVPALVATTMLLAAPVGARAAGAFPGRVVDVSSTPTLAEGEEFLAANPADPRQVLVGSNQWQPPTTGGTGLESLGPSGFTTCALWYSHDGGSTWRGQMLGDAGLQSMSPPVPNPVPTVPVLGTVQWEFQAPGSVLGADQYPAWSPDGKHAYYECLYFGAGTLHPGPEQLWFFHSEDGGATWSAPQVVQDEASSNTHADRGFLTVDPRDGTVYLTWESIVFQPVTPHVYLRVGRPQADGSVSFGPIIQVDDAGHQGMWSARQVTQVAGDGTLYIAYNSTLAITPAEFDPQLTPLHLVLATSRDRGAHFSFSVIDDNVRRVPSPDEAFHYFTEMVGAFAVSPTDPARMAEAWPNLVDSAPPSCIEATPGCVARIALRTSVDGGRTWSPRVDIADDPPATANQHDHATLAYLPDGRLLVAWRDRRFGGMAWTGGFDVFLRVGTPTATGYTFGPAVRLTERTQPPTTEHHGTMPTEYMGLAADASGVDASWDQLDASGSYPDNVFRHLGLGELARLAKAGAGGPTAAPNTSRAPGVPPPAALLLAAPLALGARRAMRPRRAA